MSKQSTDTDVAFIAALAELLNKNELTELSVKREYGDNDSLDVRVVKAAPVVHQVAAPVYASAPVHARNRYYRPHGVPQQVAVQLVAGRE